MDKDEILAGYGAWLRRREYSPATIEKYTGALARFFAESAAQAAPGKETVAAWRDSLAARGYTPATVNAMLAAVNDYQESIGNAAGKAKPLKRQRRVFCDADRELTRAEYFRLLAAARDSGNTRALLLLETICATGIRVSELVYITAEAVQCRRASIRCKGKCREILLPAELCRRLQKWCRKRRIHTGPVFLSRTGRALSRVTVWKIMKALCSRARVAWKKVFPHNLRHLFARTFYEVDKNIAKLADLLGHSSIETTRIYTVQPHFLLMASSGYAPSLHCIIHISRLAFFELMKYNKKCCRRCEYGLHDTQRSKREMGSFVPSSQLLLRRWAYSRRCENGWCLADPKRGGQARR